MLLVVVWDIVAFLTGFQSHVFDSFSSIFVSIFFSWKNFEKHFVAGEKKNERAVDIL